MKGSKSSSLILGSPLVLQMTRRSRCSVEHHPIWLQKLLGKLSFADHPPISMRRVFFCLLFSVVSSLTEVKMTKSSIAKLWQENWECQSTCHLGQEVLLWDACKQTQMIDPHQQSYGLIRGCKISILQQTSHSFPIQADSLTQIGFRVIIKWPRRETKHKTRITLNFMAAQTETPQALTSRP